MKLSLDINKLNEAIEKNENVYSNLSKYAVSSWWDGNNEGFVVNILDIKGNKFYLCSGFEFKCITSKKEEVIKAFDNSFNDELTEEQVKEKEKLMEELKNFLIH